MTSLGIRPSRLGRSATAGAGTAAVVMAVALALGGCSSDSTNLATLPGSTTSPGMTSSSAGPSSGSSSAGASTTPSSGATLEGADLVTVGVAAPPDATQAEVFNAYVEFWQADMAALTRSDPTWQPLLDRLSGQQKTSTLALLTSNRDQGKKITGTITIRPQVLVVTGDAATVRDCLDLSRTQAVDSAGQPVTGTRGKAGADYSVTMVRQASTWAVSNIDSSTGPACTG